MLEPDLSYNFGSLNNLRVLEIRNKLSSFQSLFGSNLDQKQYFVKAINLIPSKLLKKVLVTTDKIDQVDLDRLVRVLEAKYQ